MPNELENASSPRPRQQILLVSWLDAVDRGGQINLLRIVQALDRARFEPTVVVPGRGPLFERLTALGVRALEMAFGPVMTLLHKGGMALPWRRLLAANGLASPAVVYVDAPDYVSQLRRACGGATRVLWHAQTSTPSPQDAAALRQADAVVSVSPSVDARLARASVRPRRLVRIPNAVDAEAFCPGGDGGLRGEVAPGERVILYVSALEAAKGVEDLLRAFATLRRPDVCLWMVGRGDARSRERYASLAVALGVGARVRWWGSQADVVRFYRSCDVFAFPSHAEGLPLALLEAMATGCACIGTDVPGVRHLLADGAGTIVPPRDPSALASALAALLDAPDRRRAYSLAARGRVLAFYTLPAFERAFNDLFLDLAS